MAHKFESVLNLKHQNKIEFNNYLVSYIYIYFDFKAKG